MRSKWTRLEIISITLARLEQFATSANNLSENDQVCFPQWLRRSTLTFRKEFTDELPVNRDTTIRFPRSLWEAGAPARQRWQAIRTIECYRNAVLVRSQPDLTDIIGTLTKLGKQERNLDLRIPPLEEKLAQLRGQVDRSEPTLIQTMRGEMRVLHYSIFASLAADKA